MIVCAWGNDGMHIGRAKYVVRMLEKTGYTLHYLKLTDRGESWHPLYLKADLKSQRLIKHSGRFQIDIEHVTDKHKRRE